ncbi:response regulator [Halobacteriovorax sp. JY17]|uniref:response regulator n=1 Tax=Halobacteriovorax sp. JY17 TaxID=2014617 RepID=UPI0025C46BE0|nr:response regulator [Halobacteriovorax sp. JY17]
MNILIVDDDEITSKLIEKRLKKRGFHTSIVNGGVDCLHLLKQSPHYFDLILLDIMMPDMTGLEVMEEIRKSFSQVELPIIMTTSMSETSDIVSALKLGANDYVMKPINMEILEARMKTHLSIKEMNIENMKKSELETANAMIVTYHHEINNPLAIALGYIEKCEMTGSLEGLDKVHVALDRIADIVEKIKHVSQETSISKEDYANDQKMIKLK